MRTKVKWLNMDVLGQANKFWKTLSNPSTNLHVLNEMFVKEVFKCDLMVMG